MNADNGFYGHRAILARYCGLGDRVPPIWGYLQHGYNFGTGFPDHYRMLGVLPKLVWNEANAAAARAAGMRRVEIVGAPFLYLRSMLPDPGPGHGTIAYPFHAAVRDKRLLGPHDEYIAALQAREQGPITVCLYWREHQDPDVRRLYEAAGFEVICHGGMHDVAFLLRQHAALGAHRRMVTNRVATALFHAAALGREVEVYGPVFSVVAESEGAAFHDLQQQRWPEVTGGAVGGDAARMLADRELGAAQVRNAEELRALLGWSGLRRVLGPVASAALRVRRRVKGLDVAPRPQPLPPGVTS